jgi:hypothetical protein
MYTSSPWESGGCLVGGNEVGEGVALAAMSIVTELGAMFSAQNSSQVASNRDACRDTDYGSNSLTPKTLS